MNSFGMQNMFLRTITETGQIFSIILITLLLSPAWAVSQQTVSVMIGHFDTGTFQANNPRGVTRIEGTRNFALVDYDDKAISIVDQMGILQKTLDISSNSTRPEGIAYIPGSNQFAVVDTQLDAILTFDLNGSLVNTIDISSNSTNPTGIDYIQSADQFVIVDSFADEVFIFSSSGSLNSHFDTTVLGNDGAYNPQGVAYLPDTNELAIAEASDDRIYLVDFNGFLQDEIETGFISSQPHGLCYVPETDAYVLTDFTADEVFFLNAQGSTAGSFDTFEFGAEEPSGITSIVSSGNWAIVDTKGAEVYIVDASGTLQSQFDISSFAPKPQGIAHIPGTDTFNIVDSSAHELFRVASNGTLLGQFDTATFGINSFAPSGVAYLQDTDYGAITDVRRDIYFADPWKRPGRIVGQLTTRILVSTATTPQGIVQIPENGHLAVVDNTADEIFVMDHRGVLQARVDTEDSIGFPDPRGIAYDHKNQIFAVLDHSKQKVFFLNLPCLVQPGDRCEGDFDQDGDVDGSDLATFAADFGRTECP